MANMWLGMAEGGAPLGIRMPSGVIADELGFSAMEGCLDGIKIGKGFVCERDGQGNNQREGKERKSVDLRSTCVCVDQ